MLRPGVVFTDLQHVLYLQGITSALDKNPAIIYTDKQHDIITYLTKAPSCVLESGFQVRKSRDGGNAYVVMALRKD
jgi:hypothetical protein